MQYWIHCRFRRKGPTLHPWLAALALIVAIRFPCRSFLWHSRTAGLFHWSRHHCLERASACSLQAANAPLPEGQASGPSRLEQIQEAIRRGEQRAEVEAQLEKELAAASREHRINRTLEFCPDGELAWTIIREMCQNGTAPGVRAWNAVIDAFGQRGALDEALSIFSKMNEEKVAANGVTFDVLAKPAMRRGEYRFVERLYAAKLSDHATGIGPESLTILLLAYGNGHPPQTDKAETAFRQELDLAKDQGLPLEQLATPEVLRALRVAVGTNQTCELCWEFGIDPALML
mmetsp:Transcript_73600/g.145867  ORF Transcript_73600/g.145867 Transcript_73600/m.145867 type:complete len:289 (+) Transcript_73600:50-916(+)